MISVDSAVEKILQAIETLKPVRVPLMDALGRVLANDVRAPEPLPSFTNSAMDGYAVRACDLRQVPTILHIIEKIPAGTTPQRNLEPLTASQIMTGAPLPPGADAVIPVEQTETLSEHQVRILSSAKKFQFVRSEGSEIKPGEKILSRGDLLDPPKLGLLASLGIISVEVIPKPTLSILTTGSEVVDTSVKPQWGQIRNANFISISSAVRSLGCPVVILRHVGDDPALMEHILTHCGTNVIITCGGVSVGEFDFVKSVLSKAGEIFFWKVAMKPGKPFLFGRINQSWFFGLPGNPVSALVTFEILVKPALYKLAGLNMKPPASLNVILSKEIRHRKGLTEYVRVRIHQEGLRWVADPIHWQESNMLRSLTESNAWAVIPQESEDLPSGSEVDIIGMDDYD